MISAARGACVSEGWSRPDSWPGKSGVPIVGPGFSRDELPDLASRAVCDRGRSGRIGPRRAKRSARAFHQPVRRSFACAFHIENLTGARHLLFDVDYARAPGPAVLASACKILGAKQTADGGFRFFAEGPDRVEAVIRVALDGPPRGHARQQAIAVPRTLLGSTDQDPAHPFPQFTKRALAGDPVVSHCARVTPYGQRSSAA